MQTDHYREQIEKNILDIIEKRLQSGEMTPERAKEIAKYVLDILHPHMTVEQIYATVQKFDHHFPELAQAALPVIGDYEDKMKKLIAEKAGKLIQQNKLDEADKLLKDALDETK